MIGHATEKNQLHEIQDENTIKNSTEGWEKLPDTIQGMILNDMVTNDETMPPSLCLKQSKALQVTVIVNFELSSSGYQGEAPTTMVL